MDFANKAITFSNYMTYWTNSNPAIFITCFYPLPVLFNLLNVRRYGEIEYWLTVFKIASIVALILTGTIIALGERQHPFLCTTAQDRAIECQNRTVGISKQGLTCINLFDVTEPRLARNTV